MKQIDIYADPTGVARAAADLFVTLAGEAIARHGRFLVALAGGETPRETYRLLAGEPYASHVDWANVHCCWGDERCVPPDNVASNYRLAWETLLARVPLPPDNIHRIYGEWAPELAAAAYERELHDLYRSSTRDTQKTAVPLQSKIQNPKSKIISFDLLLLGLGDNGHTASLFPNSPALHEQLRWVVPVRTDSATEWRITLTFPVLNAGAQIIFMVTGAQKAECLREVLYGPDDPERLPAQLVKPTDGDTHWLIDKTAAERL